MPKRKVCDKCGYINSPEFEYCENCNADISLVKQILIPKGENHPFYDEKTDTFLNESPFKNNKEKPVEKVEVIKEKEEEDTSNLVKICPACKHKNPANVKECEQCGMFLAVKPIKDPDINIIDELVEDKPLEVEGIKEKYVLLFGKDEDNKEEVKFNEKGLYAIGRLHQKCLEDDCLISRNHCYILKDESSNFFLVENPNHPSGNGTYLRIIGDRKEKIIPGRKYQIKHGTVFYLYETPVTFLKEK